MLIRRWPISTVLNILPFRIVFLGINEKVNNIVLLDSELFYPVVAVKHRKQKPSFWAIADVGSMGLLIGQLGYPDTGGKKVKTIGPKSFDPSRWGRTPHPMCTSGERAEIVSACRQISANPSVLEWQIVTVASFISKSIATGFPTILERPNWEKLCYDENDIFKVPFLALRGQIYIGEC